MAKRVLKWRERNEVSLYSPRSPRFYWRGQSGVPSCMTDVDMRTRATYTLDSEPSSGKVLSAAPNPPSARLAFVFRSVEKFVHEKSRKLDRAIAPTIPANVLQMNDQPESHKPFFSARSMGRTISKF